jgi:GDPmannose 4,6-dehydratase
LGITPEFAGQGIREVALVEKISGSQFPALPLGQTVVRIDPRYSRSTEVVAPLGNAAKTQ